MNEVEISSPCISVCMLDDNDICMGCYRSAEEIADWFLADVDQKRQILGRCRERREAAATIKLG